VFRGLEKIAASHRLGLREFLGKVETIVHGTTITTNAVLTGTGAKTGFLTTKGFRDILNMRRGLKERQYDSKYSPPPPLVPRHRIYPIKERVNVEGKEVVPLNEQEVRRAIDDLRTEEVEAVAVSYLWSFLSPAHERRTGELLRKALPHVYLSLSTEILPQIRVYERHSTTALNAYVGPPLDRYLTNLEERLITEGFLGVLLIMQSNGGVMSPQLTRRFAANTLLSGPAGGPMAGIFYGDTHSLTDVVTIDMGGTSFDACLIRHRQPTTTTEGQIGGHRLALPMLDIHTVGAGGGSIAWIDAGGLLQVGPKSAGAEPGPVCYGLGGTEPTVTDADLLLGYLDPDFFLGGEIRLDCQQAEKAMAEKIARPLGLSVTQAAEGVYRIINANMAAALRVVSVEKGYDPREFALVVAGGAGPLHAGMIARELEIPLILVPRESSVFCAAGMLISDLQHDYVRTFTRDWGQISVDEINSTLATLEQEGRNNLAQEGIAAERMRIAASLDIRYVGQFHEVEVSAPARLTVEILREVEQQFHRSHDALYGYAMPGTPLEIINLRLQASGVTDKPSFEPVPFVGTDPSPARKGQRRAYFAGEWQETPVYDGLKCEHGFTMEGPALVEQPNTTILVPPSYRLVCDAYRNYVLHLAERKLDDLLAKLRQGR
jgi:N-methylhydantoinase A